MVEQRKSITMKDVALEAGVSVGTVSRVINKEKGIKEVTLRKVQRAIKTLDYIPDNYARGMKKNRTETIALIIPSIWHPFFSEFAYHVEKELLKYNYKLFICNADSDSQNEIEYIEMLKQNKVDGIIGITYSDIDKYILSDLPFVSIDRHFSENVCYVTSANYKGGQTAAEELVRRDNKHLAFIGSINMYENETVLRSKGFREKAKELGVDVYNFEMKEPLINPEDQIRIFLQSHKEIDGIFTINDMMALRVISVMKELGKIAPDDYQIIGFDGLKTSVDQSYLVSTIVQDIGMMAKESVAMILKMIKREEILEKRIVIPTYFWGDKTTKKI